MRKIAGMLACLGLSGCFFSEGPWPVEGAGGFAEYLPITDKQLENLSNRLEALRARGAERYAAAAFAEASLLLTRSRREVAAGLMLDANRDIERLEGQVEAMEANLGRMRVSAWFDRDIS